MVYRSKDFKFQVELPNGIVDDLVSFIKPSGNRETGGIILGRYNDTRDCAVLEMVTPAPSDSRSGYTWFSRGVNGLQKLITSMWKKQRYYLGEWHFHPHAQPIPSGIDISQMASIAKSKQYNCPEPVLLIIGGNPSEFAIAIFIVLSNTNVVQVCAEIHDEESCSIPQGK